MTNQDREGLLREVISCVQSLDEKKLKALRAFLDCLDGARAPDNETDDW